MRRTILIYSLAVAAAAFALQWIEYRWTVQMISTRGYVVLIAVFFTGLGVCVGHRLFAADRSVAGFERNRRAIASLGLTERELEVLELVAGGHSNKEIGERLFVSANTVKTHLANVYGKLEVSRRTQAVQKARELLILP